MKHHIITRYARVAWAQEAQNSHSVSHWYHNDIPSVCDLLATVQIVVEEVWSHGTAHYKTASVEPNHDWQVWWHFREEYIFKCVKTWTALGQCCIWIKRDWMRQNVEKSYPGGHEEPRCWGRGSLHFRRWTSGWYWSGDISWQTWLPSECLGIDSVEIINFII